MWGSRDFGAGMICVCYIGCVGAIWVKLLELTFGCRRLDAVCDLNRPSVLSHDAIV